MATLLRLQRRRRSDLVGRLGLGGYYGQAAFEQLSTPIDIAVGIAAVAAIVWIALLVRRQADRLAAVAEQKYPGPLTER